MHSFALGAKDWIFSCVASVCCACLAASIVTLVPCGLKHSSVLECLPGPWRCEVGDSRSRAVSVSC